jgi:hypothetical protein
MTDGTLEGERSVEPCPVCGAHRLTLLEFPEIAVAGFQPYNELYMMGDRQADTLPAIGCLNCGAEWVSLEEFRAARDAPAAD